MTRPDDIVTVNPGGASGARELSVAEARKMIGQYLAATNYAAAASICIQIAEQMQDVAWPHVTAAESLYMNQQLEAAFWYANRALEIDPADADALVVKARLCMYAGDGEQALQLADTAIRGHPDDASLYMVKAELLADAGDIDGARDGFRQSIRLDARDSSSLLGLSRLPGKNFSDELIKMTEFILHSHQLSGEREVMAHFALANEYDKKGDIERHFAHLQAGNELNGRFVDFDPAASKHEARQTIEFFSAEFFAQRAQEPGNPARVVFIVGFPRCGSTLVEQILCSHPEVSGAGETQALDQSVSQFAPANRLSTGYPHWIDDLPVGALTKVADDYMQRVEPFNNSACMTDKLLNNYMLAGLIHLVFPNARIVHVQRNPIDVCYSCYKNLFFFGSVPFAYDLEHLASKYREYRRVIDHWNEVLPGRIYTVDYERLIDRQEQATRDLLQHCGLPWSDDCLNFHENRRSIKTSSNVQVRQRLYRDSIDRWKIYEDYLGPLLDLSND